MRSPFCGAIWSGGPSEGKKGGGGVSEVGVAEGGTEIVGVEIVMPTLGSFRTSCSPSTDTLASRASSAVEVSIVPSTNTTVCACKPSSSIESTVASAPDAATPDAMRLLMGVDAPVECSWSYVREMMSDTSWL